MTLVESSKDWPDIKNSTIVATRKFRDDRVVLVISGVPAFCSSFDELFSLHQSRHTFSRPKIIPMADTLHTQQAYTDY